MVSKAHPHPQSNPIQINQGMRESKQREKEKKKNKSVKKSYLRTPDTGRTGRIQYGARSVILQDAEAHAHAQIHNPSHTNTHNSLIHHGRYSAQVSAHSATNSAGDYPLAQKPPFQSPFRAPRSHANHIHATHTHAAK